MYRESDEKCNEPDEAPKNIKMMKFREKWDCLSKEASMQVNYSPFNSKPINKVNALLVDRHSLSKINSKWSRSSRVYD